MSGVVNCLEDENSVMAIEKNINKKKEKLVNGQRRQERTGSSYGQEICPVAKKCGGCQFQGLSYEKQLEKKYMLVKQCVGDVRVLRPIGMEQPRHYRNKVHAAFGRDRKGNVISGVYESGTHRIVPVESCMIEDARADAIIATIRGLLKTFKIKTYDEDTGFGLLRHVMVRTAHATGEILVVLVLASPILPAKNNFVKALRAAHPQITSIVLNVNDRKTSMVLGERNILLYGKGYIEDELCGNRYRISPNSFYQVNAIQTKVLYEKAMEYAGLTGNETVIDAYCGIGTIGMTAAAHARQVIGVELNPSAVKDAIANARRNDCKNIVFYNEDAGDYMRKLAAVPPGERVKVDVVFMDPPRSGSSEAFMDAVALLAPARVVYISCDPHTLGRDLDYLRSHGYRPVECQPVDMFPYTDDIENVVFLERSGACGRKYEKSAGKPEMQKQRRKSGTERPGAQGNAHGDGRKKAETWMKIERTGKRNESERKSGTVKSGDRRSQKELRQVRAAAGGGRPKASKPQSGKRAH